MLGVRCDVKGHVPEQPIVTYITDLARHPRSRVAIGFFDGVHLGHRAVIEGCDTVLTFDRHPMSVLAPARTPKLLMSLSQRVAAFGELGVKEVVLIPFDNRWARQTAEEFVQRVVLGTLQSDAVSVGRNFRFGSCADGTPETIRISGGLPTYVADLVIAEGAVVSSSRIRDLVANRDIDAAVRLMRRPLERTATRTPDGRFEVVGDLAIPPVGKYVGFIHGEMGLIDVGPGSHELHVSGVATPADRIMIRFLKPVTWHARQPYPSAQANRSLRR